MLEIVQERTSKRDYNSHSSNEEGLSENDLSLGSEGSKSIKMNIKDYTYTYKSYPSLNS